ncbi:hypothetical protein ABTX24_18775 [Nocardioides sp. NPDC127514]|uniref:hypothetical protein n=1 Tax=unclassified Nocardioides TaxID=2615069 RepID=UPI00332817F1
MAKRPKVTVIRSGHNTPDIVIDPSARTPYVQVGVHAITPAAARVLAKNLTKAARLAEKGA